MCIRREEEGIYKKIFYKINTYLFSAQALKSDFSSRHRLVKLEGSFSTHFP